ARGVAKLGGKLVLQQRELGGGFSRHIDQRAGDGLAVVVDAFHHEIVIHGALAADRGPLALANPAVACHAGSQQRQVQSAKRGARLLDDRQVHDLIAVVASTTSTVVVTAATCITTFAVVVLFSSTVRFRNVASAKPAFLMVMLYSPAGTLLNRYKPLASVVVVLLM